jgi:hypothetical protein
VDSHPPIGRPLDVEAVYVHYGIGVHVPNLDIVVPKEGPRDIEILDRFQVQIPRRQVEVEWLVSYLLSLPEVVDKQDHQVVVGYRILVGEDWSAEFDDQVIVFVDFDFHNLGGHVGTSIFGSLVPSIAMVVLLYEAFGAAAIFC